MKISILTTDSREHFADYSNPRPYFGTAPEALLQGLAHLPECAVHVLSCTQQPVTSPKQIAPNIYYHSLHVPKIGWLRTGYQGCIRAVRRKLKEIQPDIVHGQGTERDCAVSAVLSGFPNVVTIHGNMKAIAEVHQARMGSFNWLAARLEDFVLSRTAGVFCNSEHTENLVRPRTACTWRVPNALREIFFTPIPSRPSNSKPILLNIGVLNANKQQVELLGVGRDLHRRGLDLEIQFAGAVPENSNYTSEFRLLLAEAERAGYARHLGLLPEAQLLTTIDRADALLHFPKEEAFGLVAAEALARNLKLFVAQTGGLIDIVHGAAGVELYAPRDWSALGDGIAAWLRAGHPPTEDNSARMRSRYHPKLVARRHLEIYRETLSTLS